MRSETLAGEKVPIKEVPVDDAPSRWRFGTRHLIHLVFYAALGCWLVAVVGIPAVVVIIGLTMAAILGFALIFARRRTAQQDSLLAIVALAVEREMPLGPSLDAMSDQFGGEYRRKVRALAHYVNSGVSLPDALDREPGALPRDAEILARVGHESGTLAGALRDAGANRGVLKEVWTTVASRIIYFLCILYVIQVISGAIFYFIMPKYEAILKEFGVAPPASTRLVFGIGHAVERWSGPYVVLLLAELVLILCLPLTLLGWSRLDVPLADRVFDRRHCAVILRSIAWVVQGGLPLTRALEILAEWYPSGRIRRRLRRTLLDVEHGTDWVESMAHHGLLRRADAAVLESARRAGNLPWALRETAASGERRLAYRLQAIAQLLLPLVLLALGGLVGLLVVAYFTPLIHVIEALL